MEIGQTKDGLVALPLAEMPEGVAEPGLTRAEFGLGSCSSVPYVNFAELLGSGQARDTFMSKIRERGGKISAPNCSGNPLYHGENRASGHETRAGTVC